MRHYVYAEHGNLAARIPAHDADDFTQADVATYYSDGSDSYEDVPDCCWLPLCDADELSQEARSEIETALAIEIRRRSATGPFAGVQS